MRIPYKFAPPELPINKLPFVKIILFPLKPPFAVHVPVIVAAAVLEPAVIAVVVGV